MTTRQPLFIRCFIVIFALKPLIDLFWFTGSTMWCGQHLNPAVITGVSFIILPFVPIIKQNQFKEILKTHSELFSVYSLYFIFITYLLGKCVFFDFNDYGLAIRYASSLAVLAFLPFFMLSYKLKSWQAYLFLTSIMTILLFAILQILGLAPTTVFDTMSSTNIGRITGGYGHPLALSRVLSFYAVILLYFITKSSQRSWSHWSSYIFMYAFMTFIVFRSTYRTGILFILLLPLSLLLLKYTTLKRKIIHTMFLIIANLLVVHYGSTKILTPGNLFGHSAGFVVTEKIKLPKNGYSGIKNTLEHTLDVAQTSTKTGQSVVEVQPQVIIGGKHNSESLRPEQTVNVSRTEQFGDIGRGRGRIVLRYLKQMRKSNVLQIIFGHNNALIIDPDRIWTEPHNLIILIVYAFGLFGLMIVSIIYFKIWIVLKQHSMGQPEKIFFTSICFVVPLWYGLIAEPIRYPTFFTMLFLSVLIIDMRHGSEDAHVKS